MVPDPEKCKAMIMRRKSTFTGAIQALRLGNNIRDLKHRQLNGRRRRFPTEADWAKGFVFGGENEV